MTYQELCEMIISLCAALIDNAVDEMETEETSITLGAEIGGTHNIKITIEKREIE